MTRKASASRDREAAVHFVTSRAKNSWHGTLRTLVYERRPLCALIAALAGITATGCSGNSEYAWREEVRLQDGQLLVVERTARYEENWVAGGGGGSFNKGMTLRIPPSAASAPATVWSDRFVPLLLEREPVTHEWVLIATFFHCDSWYDLGRPPLPYTEYRYRAGQWVRQPLSPQWIGLKANVLAADPSDKAVLISKEVLTVERKKALVENSLMAPEYKGVVDNWSSGC